MSQIDEISNASGGRWYGWQTVYGFFTQVWIGHLRVNVFHHEDPAPGLHDHAWDFTSIPLRSYVEEYLDGDVVKKQVIRALRPNRKPASHTHRYLGRWSGIGTETIPGSVPTLCWTGRAGRDWAYWRTDGGKVRRLPWRAYLRRIEAKPPWGQNAANSR